MPRHDLAEEEVDHLKGINAKVVHIMPRTGGADGTLPVLCKRADYVRSIERQGIGVFRNACRSIEGEECGYYRSCDYIAQFHIPGLEVDTSNIVRIYVHNYLGLRRNPLQLDPSLVIIDESFFNAMVQIRDLSFKDIREQVRSDRHPDLGRQIIKSLVSNEPLLVTLRELNVRLGHLGEIVLNQALTAPEARRLTFVPELILKALVVSLDN